MRDAEPQEALPDSATEKAGGRRRARARKRHTVAKVLLASIVVLGMVSGLSTVFIYRHLNGNLTVLDISDKIVGARPEKKVFSGPKEPLNVLVMGSDSRDCAGCNIDNLTGGGQRSDTTILLHLSADRQRAYGVSIPRDSMVNRPACKDNNNNVIPAATYQMWNAAFSLGGPACTIQQFEHLTGIRVDHFVVVNFEGFRGMVDAIGGVEVCIPEPGIVDPAHGITIEPGTRKIKGQEALNYVRERYVVGNGSDIGRMKRQQAFIASMAHQVLTAGTLTNPVRIVKFLEAATKSLTLDPDLGSLTKIAGLGYEFRNIGLDKIQFITIPNGADPQDPNRLVWTPQAKDVWQKLLDDEPLTRRLTNGSISPNNVPGSGSPGHGPSPSPGSEADQQALQDAGLCT
ncbi:LCP family protein [Nocardioides sp.]|uniref:LCP family protein n=1 Tax=Nocardioides sp. TaxID=35761 RepID=UPI0031FECEEA|nr:cell envelope-related transcriptional attenuator [Nocardioides sp.]